MLLSNIRRIFLHELSILEFAKSIATEVSHYREALGKKGGSCPIFLNEDLQELQVNTADVSLLSNAYLDKKLDKWELNYIAEAIMLSSKVAFSDDKSEQAIFSFADPGYFELINDDYVKQVIRDLEQV